MYTDHFIDKFSSPILFSCGVNSQPKVIHVAGVSKLLSICVIFGESNDIIFNKKKSASLYFISKMLKGAHLPNVDLNGGLVKQVDSVMYLCHFLTCELSDDVHIRRQCRVLNVRGNILIRKCHMCSVPVSAKAF